MDNSHTSPGAPNADLAVTLDRMADQMAALPLPPAEITPPPAAAFGNHGAAQAAASFHTSYAETAASLTADHQAMIAYLRATAAAYRAGDTDTATGITAAGISTAEPPQPQTPPE